MADSQSTGWAAKGDAGIPQTVTSGSGRSKVGPGLRRSLNPLPRRRGSKTSPGYRSSGSRGSEQRSPPGPGRQWRPLRWRMARGGDPLRRVPTPKVENIYTFPSGPFAVLGLPRTLASSFAQEADAASKAPTSLPRLSGSGHVKRTSGTEPGTEGIGT